MSGRRATTGLSLIELLVVIVILAATAGMVISMTSGMDERLRFEETVRRLAEIRSAVLGPDVVSPTGEMLSGGYLQDVGWLPDSADDLLQSPAISAGKVIPKLTYSRKWRTWAGWRGPYLSTPPAPEGEGPSLYDDYGHPFYGWFCEIDPSQRSWEMLRLSGDMAIRSTGADGTRNDEGDVFRRDYPDVQQPLIAENEWVSDWAGLRVRIVNLTPHPVERDVCFRVIVPRWENYVDEIDQALDDNSPAGPFVSRRFRLSLTEADSDSESDWQERSFETAGVDDPLLIPHGRRMLFLVDADSGEPIPGAYAELKVSKHLSPPPLVRLMIREEVP